MSQLTATHFTPSARRWLAAAAPARVLGSFERACNLINQSGDVLALVTVERALTPFSVLIATPDPAPFRIISASDPVRVEADRLVVGRLAIDASAARLWEPTPDWPAVRRLFSTRPDALIGLAMMSALPSGSLLEIYGPRSTPLLDRARRGARDLARGLHTRSTAQCLAGVRKLAGAGGGLTPAGDDFVVGAVLAAWAGLFGPGAESLGRPLAESAAPLTTTLSAAYLRAAANGECGFLWHTLFEALTRADAEATRSAAGALLAAGHTSGADALAGFFAAAKYKPEAE